MTMTDDERVQFAAYLGLAPSIYHERDSMTKVLIAMVRKMQEMDQRINTTVEHLGSIELERRRTSTVTAHLCVSCRNWVYISDPDKNLGRCRLIRENGPDQPAFMCEDGGDFLTRADFGCRLWEAKDV